MDATLRYLSHPQVAIDPAVPVPDWGLNGTGRARTEALAAAGWLAGTRAIVSSAERKARETAAILAGPLGLAVTVDPAMHENDRSATGFLPGPEFEAVADAFFARPAESVRGWERAADAQARIVAGIARALAAAPAGDLLLVGHGGVGTLAWCHFAGRPIARSEDQPAGGGNYWAIRRSTRAPLHPWRAMEAPPPAV